VLETNKILYPTNEYQTPIDEILKSKVSEKVFADLIDFIQNVKWVERLVAPDRKYARDLPRDAKGRLIVDLEHPHVLENMSYFTKSRDTFLKNGVYTFAKPSRSPKSEFKKFWDEEKRRSIEGYVRPIDGEWISGYNYWYWNYTQIPLTKRVDNDEELKEIEALNKIHSHRADRIDSFPDIWEADYFWFHYIEQAENSGEYASLLKSRGVGASLKAASMAHRNGFLIKKSKTYLFAALDEYLYTDGLMNKVLDSEGFIQDNTAYKKRKLKGTVDGIKFGFKDKSKNNALSGYLSEINPVNVKNPNAARGKRGKLVIHEEAGSDKHILRSWDITHKSLNDRGNVFGLQMAMGTGGDKNSDFHGLNTLHYSPKGFHIKSVNNIFDRRGTGKTGWFIGEYMNRPGRYNKDGVNDIVRSLVDIFIEREIISTEIEDADVLAQKKAESAITPLEAMVTQGSSPFPLDLTRERVATITGEYETISENLHVVYPVMKGGHVQYFYNGVFPITEFPYTGNQANTAGLVLKYLPPSSEPPIYRYGIGVDTLDDDDAESEGKSLFAWMLMDFWKDEIIGWYIGRRDIVAEDYDIVLMVATSFNAVINYENNLKGLYGHFKNRGALHLLYDTPTILEEKSLINKRYTVGNKSKGTRANKAINAWGRRLQADYMRKMNTYYNVQGIDLIDDIEYMREVLHWQSNGNYDKVSSGNLLFILREDLKILNGDIDFDDDANTKQADDFDDEFFAEDELLNKFGVNLNSQIALDLQTNDEELL